LRTQTDERLVGLSRDGMDAAFEEIVRRYRPALVPFAAAYGPPDPEDVVQESLAKAWTALRESS
jgi:DNA-directed RNA polymerase specialized sigma24 family protein